MIYRYVSTRFLLLLILFFAVQSLFGQELVFSWNLGTLDVAWNHLESEYEDDFTVPEKIGLTCGDLQLSTSEYRLAVQLSLFEMKTLYSKQFYGIVAPIEMNFNFLSSDWAMLGVFGKGGLGFTETDLYPYGEIGIKLGLFIREDSLLKYSWRNSFYISVDSAMEINIGTQFDLGTMGLIALLAEAEY